MKLNQLRLLGFKSFVEPTDFHIEPGLTGVVGPNGCGKSNLVEALRWVMGETSHKSMRAADMDDVIFSGTNTRPARNTAEVMLFLDNADRTAPAQFNEHETLEVSRRIEREKGSTYRINGREVRARDVQLLFADASTGARSPALVHQGRIGEIIQAKPEQRRRVLEEAAGVAGLHARRHEAELRLRAAETNLARLEDVIGQLAQQIDGLKRQARQAVRYKQVVGRRAQGRGDAVPSALDRRQCRGRRGEPRQGHRGPPRRRATGAQAEASTRQANAAADLPPLRDEEAKAGAALQRLVMAREKLDREEARVNERIAELDRRLAQLAQDIEREQRQQADAEAALARLATEEAGLTQDGAGVAQREADVAARVERRRSSARRGREDLRRTDRRARRSHGAAQPARARRSSEHSVRLMRLEGQIGEVERELADLDKPESGAPDLAALAGAVEAAQAAVAQAEAAALRAEAAHSAARQALDVARAPLGRSRAPRRPARSRGEDARQADRRRGEEALAAGDRPAHGREGLRGGARRGARRRSRSAGRSGLADPLGRRRAGRQRSRAARGRRAARASCHRAGASLRGGWRRSAWSTARLGRRSSRN